MTKATTMKRLVKECVPESLEQEITAMQCCLSVLMELPRASMGRRVAEHLADIFREAGETK